MVLKWRDATARMQEVTNPPWGTDAKVNICISSEVEQ